MQKECAIRILESAANRKGDLFGRLMEGLFLALGYDQIRLNIHKTGREIDLQGKHRTENRRVVAECKAEEQASGGSEINKFVGSLDAERRLHPDVPTEGYFISLRGFTETALEQEAELGNLRVALLTGASVIDQLIAGKGLSNRTRATELAGRCVNAAAADAIHVDDCELLAHEIGWLWAVYFTRNSERTHFALVHADGQFIGANLARRVIASDKNAGGGLYKLIYLEPPNRPDITELDIGKARERYIAYLSSECGEIQLAGMPADQEVGSTRLKLENIFVPLFLRESSEGVQGPSSAQPAKVPQDAPSLDPKQSPVGHTEALSLRKRRSVGRILAKENRLAILGPPGGGKSTLLKRIAIAYAFPARRSLIRDHLPKRNWLPLLIRCRHLDTLARRPIAVVLDEVPTRAEMPDELKGAFSQLVKSALRSGEALLLIDGLDEISDEGSRLSFANQLCTFLCTYPNVAVVLTSREAGFRVIGGTLGTYCKHYQLAEFDYRDIQKLTVAWHKLVVGDSARIRKDALALAGTIWTNSRVRILAENPLLLTTLLLVQRWVGQLPTKRSVLYAKAIEVLLMTWNVEAHEPLDQDEALPQLEFLAFSMMRDGTQRISHRDLVSVLTKARQEMPELLSYARIGVSDFIKRVELRSSLLMMGGHELDQGSLSAIYEFRHLTFQEYLTARAVVFGHYPGRNEGDTLVGTLQPNIGDDNWREVIPLAAVLAGRECQPLLSKLVESCRECSVGEDDEADDDDMVDLPPCQLLATCLADEVQVKPELLNIALGCVAENCRTRYSLELVGRSKYRAAFSEAVRHVLRNGKRFLTLGGYVSGYAEADFGFRTSYPLRNITIQAVESLLCDADTLNVATGCLAIMQIAFERSDSARPSEPRSRSKSNRLRKQDKSVLESWLSRVLYLLQSKEDIVQFSASWALAWLTQVVEWDGNRTPGALTDLLSIWIRAQGKSWGYMPAWAVASLPLGPRKSLSLANPSSELLDFIRARASEKAFYEKWAAYTLAYYIEAPWADRELAEKISSEESKFPPHSEYKLRLLSALGQHPG